MATTAGEGPSYQGGAGGKYRKMPLKKSHTTPYDRPPTAARGGDGWVSKMLMDPASKLASAGAQLFFPSVFRKLLPPPTSRGASQESRDRFLDAVILSPVGDQGQTLKENGKQGLFEGQGRDINSGKQMKTTDSTGLSELELLLKQRTFTKSEIDHLTELLHSRTVEFSNGDGEKNTKFCPQESGSALRGPGNFVSSLHETRNGSHSEKRGYDGRVSTAIVSSKVLEEDVATPIELAKAYMGNSSSKVSPLGLGMHSQAIREECSSPVMSLVQKPSVQGAVLENGFATPRSRGRSAIYSMARTPYSRVHPTASNKGNISIYDGYGGPSASSSNGFARELVARSVSKDLALKRRSSVLDDEIGSVGPIRRMRQKTNLSTPTNTNLLNARTRFSSRETEIVPNGALDTSSSSKTFQRSEDNESMPGTRYMPVPSQSKDTARKILQQLQNLSPKEKQFEGKISAVSEKSPSKLTPNMLHGQALKSLEDVDSSKILHGAEYSLKCKQKVPLPDACETSSQRQDKVEENGPKSFNVSQGSLVPAGTSNGSVLFKDTVTTFALPDPLKKQAVTQSSPKKWGFQMSAHEDLSELDDEIHSSDAAPATLDKGKKILETPVVDSKIVPVTEDKTTSVTEFKAPTGSFEFGKPTDLVTSLGTKVVEKNSGKMFSDVPTASTLFPPVVSVSQSTTFASQSSDKEQNAPTLPSSSGAKIDDKTSPLTFSSSPFVGGSIGLKSTPPADVKQETTKSFTTDSSGTTETVPKPVNTDNGGIQNMQRPRDTVRRPDTQRSGDTVRPESLFPLPQSTSFSPSTIGSSLIDGPLNSTTHSENQTIPNPFTGFAFSANSNFAPPSEASPSTSGTTSSLLAPAYKFESTSNSIPSTTTSPAPLAPAFNFGSTSNSTPFTTTSPTPLAPTLNFGSSSNITPSTITSVTPSLTTAPDFKFGSPFMAPSTYSTVPTTSSATDVNASTEKQTGLGNLPSNPFSSTSFPIAGTGSSIFGFTAGSTTSSSAASPSQGSLFGTGSVSAVSTQSMPVFGSSAPSSTLGTSGSSPFATGSSIFSSSTSSSSVFGNTAPSSFVFGSNNTSSSSLFSSSTSSNSLFGSSTTSIGSSSSFVLGSSAPSSIGFSFGAAPSQGPAFGSTGASSSCFFSFGSAAQTQPVFGSSVAPAFGSASGGTNGDQMTMAEDSMAEDQVQAGPAPTSSVPVFGQPLVQNPSPSPFMFGTTNPSSSAVSFQFGGQQSQPGAQHPNPFPSSGNSLDFGGGGSSFSLGSGGGDDKSSRRIIRVKHKSRRK